MADIKLDTKPVNKDHTGVLASLWRKVILENKLSTYLGIMVNNYLSKSKALDSKSDAIKRKNKTTLVENITASKMTFKTFVDLLFNVVGCIKLDISIKVYFKGGKTSVHTVTLTHVENTDDEEAEDEGKDTPSSK